MLMMNGLTLHGNKREKMTTRFMPWVFPGSILNSSWKRQKSLLMNPRPERSKLRVEDNAATMFDELIKS